MFNKDEKKYMRMVLNLAKKGLYSSMPNPRVGCVIVKNKKILSEGWHVKPGDDHAEIVALKKCKRKIKGATMFVNLEPCNTYGLTPDCESAVISSGISKIIYSIQDPNNKENNVDKYKSNSIEVVQGLLKDESSYLNKGFFSRINRKRPWLTCKVAAGLDGKTALENLQSKWITSEKSRLDVQSLRAQSCAILTGIGTISADDPMLNVRNINVPRQPFIFVLDSKLRIKLDAKILSNPNLFLITAQKKDSTKYKKLKKLGINLKSIPNSFNKVHLHKLMKLFNKMKFNEVLVESGMNLNSALYSEGLIDEFVIYYAPKILGDAGRGMLYIQDALNMSDIPSNKIISYKKIGPDLKINFLTSYH